MMPDVGALLKSFIYLVSSSLLYPTLVLLTLIVLWMLVYAGSFLAEAIGRARLRPVSGSDLSNLDFSGDLSEILPFHVRAYMRAAMEVFGAGSPLQDELLENLLQERSAQLRKSLDTIRMLVRIGPGLGLIGTLIPMGTGLAALGQGDITKLSSDLVIAFTTTVVGLATGLTAYYFYWKKRRWVEEDIRSMEFLTEVLAVKYSFREISHEVHEAQTDRRGE